jgi:hypothetical protein
VSWAMGTSPRLAAPRCSWYIHTTRLGCPGVSGCCSLTAARSIGAGRHSLAPMLISFTVSTEGANDLDGSAGNGLVCTGQGSGSRLVIRSAGIYAAAALTSWSLGLYNGATLVSTLATDTTVTSDAQDELAVPVPQGWTVQARTAGASQGCTVWVEMERTTDV